MESHWLVYAMCPDLNIELAVCVSVWWNPISGCVSVQIKRHVETLLQMSHCHACVSYVIQMPKFRLRSSDNLQAYKL